MLTCFDIANYFIKIGNQTDCLVSNLKLQKLVYYAQSWYLALYNKPLFNEDFEAWIHGPVIPALYQEYKSCSWHPIQVNVDTQLPSDIIEFLEEISEEYLIYDGYELEQMTHLEKPWQQARKNLSLDEPSNNIIKKEWMEEYYRSYAKETENSNNTYTTIKC